MNLTEFLRKQGLVAGQWDLLMFGDGSGMSWKELHTLRRMYRGSSRIPIARAVLQES